MRKKITITIETQRTVSLRREPNRNGEWCSECHEYVDLIDVEQAALILGVDHQTLNQLAQMGDLHPLSQFNRARLICLNSVLQYHGTDTTLKSITSKSQ
ncbi:MAG: hypothetical protein HY774_00670 [Acidobacteria bacterium]|nr:hypothetical protein [Acidobacteriota bacterium]